MFFQYLKTETYMDSIDLEDIGNCCLVINNDECEEWYLKIKTSLGWSECIIFGPLTIDDDGLGYNFYYSYNKFEYNEKRLYKTINDFINNPKKQITQARIIEENDFNTKLNKITFTR